MFEELKKKSFKNSLWGTVFSLVIGVVLICISASSAFYAVAGYADFEQLTPEEIRNQTVTFEMTTNFGYYLEEYEENTETHRRTTTDLYYIIWTGDEYATDYRYMTVKVPASFEKKMDAMAENTYNNLLSDPILIAGKIRKLSDEEYKYFVEFFEESGWTAEEIEEGTLPYYIDYYNSVSSMNVMYILFFVGGVALTVYGIFRLVKASKGGYLKKLHDDIATAGYSESTIESDFARATSMTKNGSIKIGSLMTYYESGSCVRAIPNNKIMWAYQNTVTHRTNGIKTGTTYNVMIYAETRKTDICLSVPNEATAQEMLQKMSNMFPWIVIGYSDQLKKMFNKDRAQFLNLRYNTCEHVAVEPGFEDFANTINDQAAQ